MRNKFNRRNKAKRTDGYKSEFESEVANQLNAIGVRFGYELRVLDGRLKFKYTPDFFLDNGVVIEAKGLLDPGTRKRFLAIREQYPDLDLRLVFQRNNKLNPGSPYRYSDWCERNGITYSIGRVPVEWLRGATLREDSNG